MFKRPQHRHVLALLKAFDSEKLARCRFFFGGGTRIVLELDEYRESRDVDFLCSDREGYAELRAEASTSGYPALFKPGAADLFRFLREMRTDQYGIRFAAEVEGEVIRVELIREARIDLDPGVRPDWSPVDCLSLTDCQAEKLLANSDRWADRQVLSRDLIDLGALRSRCGPVPEVAWAKAENAYKKVIREDLLKALDAFNVDTLHQRRCFEGLHIDRPEEVLAGLSSLRQDIS
ncbi:MAG TPA: nucleotidyl transferase AbiEii/AbiGii toxin family protein [Thermoanaerobaculia bacterium]